MKSKKADPFQKKIEASNKRIGDALEVLQSHHRGRGSLSDFKRLASGPAAGLDLVNMDALVTLVNEWSTGRRDFLKEIE